MSAAGKVERVKVVVRCRPMNSKERARGCTSIIDMDVDIGQVSIRHPKAGEPTGGGRSSSHRAVKRFTYDSVYDDKSEQKALYQETAYPVVEAVLQGYNGTIFAYGQTGCGKTHSMQGPASDPGIIPQSFSHVFDHIKATTDTEYLVRAQYIEIYNEQVRDLLGDDPLKSLALKEDPSRGVFVQGCKQEVVDTAAAIQDVMERGFNNRTVGKTNMNDESSRSHSLFTMIVEASSKDDAGTEHLRAGKMNLVDLAGSERQNKTGATGARLLEGCKINLSLSALGNVISALVDGNGKHIPYRDSKLTRLLQDSLGGSSMTTMVAAVSPADYNYDETLSTLNYANRAKNIKNKPKINEDPKDALLRKYKEEIERLRQMLAGQVVASPPAAAALGAHGTALQREQSQLQGMVDKQKRQDERAAKLGQKASSARHIAPPPHQQHDQGQQQHDQQHDQQPERRADAASPREPAAERDGPRAEGKRGEGKRPAAAVVGTEVEAVPVGNDAETGAEVRPSDDAEAVAEAGATEAASAQAPEAGSAAPAKAAPAEVKEVVKEVPVYRDREVVKEVPVYRDREVVKEVVKEVPVYKDREVVKEVEVVRELPSEEAQRQRERDRRALQGLNEAVVQQRNALGQRLEQTEAEAAAHRSANDALRKRMEELQALIIGRAAQTVPEEGETESAAPVEDPEVAIARQQAEYRRAQHRLRQHKKKQAQMERERARAEAERAAVEEDLKAAHSEVVEKSRSLRRQLKRATRELESVSEELADARRDAAAEKELLLEAVREQNREARLFEQLTAVFLPRAELDRVRARAEWDEDRETWRLPRLRPRRDFAPLSLPGLGSGVRSAGGSGGAGSGGAEVDDTGPLSYARPTSRTTSRNGSAGSKPRTGRPPRSAGVARDDAGRLSAARRSPSRRVRESEAEYSSGGGRGGGGGGGGERTPATGRLDAEGFAVVDGARRSRVKSARPGSRGQRQSGRADSDSGADAADAVPESADERRRRRAARQRRKDRERERRPGSGRGSAKGASSGVPIGKAAAAAQRAADDIGRPMTRGRGASRHGPTGLGDVRPQSVEGAEEVSGDSSEEAEDDAVKSRGGRGARVAPSAVAGAEEVEEVGHARKLTERRERLATRRHRRTGDGGEVEAEAVAEVAEDGVLRREEEERQRLKRVEREARARRAAAAHGEAAEAVSE